MGVDAQRRTRGGQRRDDCAEGRVCAGAVVEPRCWIDRPGRERLVRERTVRRRRRGYRHIGHGRRFSVCFSFGPRRRADRGTHHIGLEHKRVGEGRPDVSRYTGSRIRQRAARRPAERIDRVHVPFNNRRDDGPRGRRDAAGSCLVAADTPRLGVHGRDIPERDGVDARRQCERRAGDQRLGRAGRDQPRHRRARLRNIRQRCRRRLTVCAGITNARERGGRNGTEPVADMECRRRDALRRALRHYQSPARRRHRTDERCVRPPGVGAGHDLFLASGCPQRPGRDEWTRVVLRHNGSDVRRVGRHRPVLSRCAESSRQLAARGRPDGLQGSDDCQRRQGAVEQRGRRLSTISPSRLRRRPRPPRRPAPNPRRVRPRTRSPQTRSSIQRPTNRC
jgi:hypothetical protein